jgi:hypothetical protein
MDMNTFDGASRGSEFKAILESAFSKPGGVTLQSIHSNSMTGVEAKQLYFPQNKDIRLFSVVHLTRVVVRIRTDDDANTAKLVSASLASLCANIAPVAIDTVGPPAQSAFDFIQQIPPLVGFVLLCVLVVATISCGVCWLCVLCHCCRRKKEQHREVAKDTDNQPTAQPEPGPSKPIEVQPQTKEFPPPSAPSLALLRLRLPLELESADRYDLYAEPTNHAGPAAVRLASWPVDPDPPPT